MKVEDMMDHEIEEIKKGFKYFDKYNTGKIKTEEIGLCLRYLKLVPTQAQIAAFMELGDPEKRGRISFETFLSMAAQLWCSDAQKREGEIWGAFLCFDKADKGKLPAEELKKILTEYGEEPIPEKEANAIIKAFVDKKENTVEYGYIIRAWQK
ncbi:unnamed protein product [Dibothriocephalus latus]|uniref:EF-hand domain-containing protein n=1 Tax=Dibothriocephalus latus TaxID=60516 RepID=A0A3P7PCI0_DIBLA|nr:unnamed protein product [Dibothriocephalus latus]